MKKIILLIIACFVIIATAPAFAVDLSLIPANKQINIGGTASLDLVVSGLGNGTAPSIGAFDVTLNYDPSVLSLTNVTFGDHSTGVDYLDVYSFGSNYTYFDLNRLIESSFDFPADLDAFQPSSFILATIDFLGTGVGSSAIDFDLGFTLLSDSDFFPYELTVDNFTGANVAVVPEPATMLLLGTGIAGLAGLRRKKSIKKPN